jgi:hypothetical protein
MDADVLPTCNLDYYFYLNATRYAPNIVIAWNSEPAQGGFFMLETGGWEDLIRLKYLNATHGFGNSLAQHPAMGLNDKNYTEWNWYGATIDQGILYHWDRYVKNSVSLITNARVQTWVQGTLMEDSHDRQFLCPNHSRLARRDRFFRGRHGLYKAHIHFTGRGKPWSITSYSATPPENETKCETTLDLWQWALAQALLSNLPTRISSESVPECLAE